MPRIELTANATEQEVLTLGPDETGCSVHVSDDADLGGGTLSLLRRSATQPAEDPEVLDAALVAGSQYEYRTGSNTTLLLTLSGATAPDIVAYVEAVR